jgi:DNA-binding transcriptional ArsR family regulator
LDESIQVFSALSEPIRIRILQQIASADELACVVLDANLGITKSTISYHIKLLRRAQLISVRKQGRRYFYTLRRDVLDHFVPGLIDRLRAPLNEPLDVR